MMALEFFIDRDPLTMEIHYTTGEKPQCQGTMVTKFYIVAPIHVGPQYGICFMSSFWHLNFCGGS